VAHQLPFVQILNVGLDLYRRLQAPTWNLSSISRLPCFPPVRPGWRPSSAL
jgi:hypothetical protein